MSGNNQPDPFFEDLGREAYQRWQERQEAKDKETQTAHNKLVIENGDPELEAAISALEQGWRDEGR